MMLPPISPSFPSSYLPSFFSELPQINIYLSLYLYLSPSFPLPLSHIHSIPSPIQATELVILEQALHMLVCCVYVAP